MLDLPSKQVYWSIADISEERGTVLLHVVEASGREPHSSPGHNYSAELFLLVFCVVYSSEINSNLLHNDIFPTSLLAQGLCFKEIPIVQN